MRNRFGQVAELRAFARRPAVFTRPGKIAKLFAAKKPSTAITDNDRILARILEVVEGDHQLDQSFASKRLVGGCFTVVEMFSSNHGRVKMFLGGKNWPSNFAFEVVAASGCGGDTNTIFAFARNVFGNASSVNKT